jgi:hypothetical protein
MNRPEQTLQRQVVAFLNATAPNCIFYHVPNGGGRSRVEAAILKGLGVRAGVPDLAFVLADGRAAFIELKADNGRQSPAQALFQMECERMGVPYAVCRSLAEVQGTLDGWRVILRGRVAA